MESETSTRRRVTRAYLKQMSDIHHDFGCEFIDIDHQSKHEKDRRSHCESDSLSQFSMNYESLIKPKGNLFNTYALNIDFRFIS